MEDFVASAPSTWTFTPAEPRQCLTIIIVQNVQFESTEVICVSFDQEVSGVIVTEETKICIIDDEPGNHNMY